MKIENYKDFQTAIVKYEDSHSVIKRLLLEDIRSSYYSIPQAKDFLLDRVEDYYNYGYGSGFNYINFLPTKEQVGVLQRYIKNVGASTRSAHRIAILLNNVNKRVVEETMDIADQETISLILDQIQQLRNEAKNSDTSIKAPISKALGGDHYKSLCHSIHKVANAHRKLIL